MLLLQYLLRHQLVVSLGLIAIASIGVIQPSSGQYFEVEQFEAEDVILIGNTPGEWAQHRAYWQRLLKLNPPPRPAPSEEPSTVPASASKTRTDALIKNLIVSELDFKAMPLRGSSSQVIGKIKNNNTVPVAVESISFEIVDDNGALIRTGAAVPQPAIIPAGQAVTFNADYLGFPRKPSYVIRLTDAPLFVRGG